MKKLVSFLLITALLLSFTVTAWADTDDAGSGSGSSSQIVVVPSEDHLPDDCEIDEEYNYTFTMGEENGWTYTVGDLTSADDDGEYIYYIVEEDVAAGYTPQYQSGNSGPARKSRVAGTPYEGSGSNVVIIRNVKEGEAPVYELPKTGGIGTMPYTVAGTAILLIAAVYGIILAHKRKKSA